MRKMHLKMTTGKPVVIFIVYILAVAIITIIKLLIYLNFFIFVL